MSEAEIGVAMYLCKKDMDIIFFSKNNDQENLCRAYRVTIGQRKESLRTKLEARDRYEEISSSGDVIELPKRIKNKGNRVSSNRPLAD